MVKVHDPHDGIHTSDDNVSFRLFQLDELLFGGRFEERLHCLVRRVFDVNGMYISMDMSEAKIYLEQINTYQQGHAPLVCMQGGMGARS